MLFAKVGPDGTIEEYPIGWSTLRARLLNVSLPNEPTDASLAPHGYVCVKYRPPPSPTAVLGAPSFEDGQWVRTFVEVAND